MTARTSQHRLWRLTLTLLIGFTLWGNMASAQSGQRQVHGHWEAHYIVLPTTALSPEIAARNGITRSNNMAFINISILDARQTPAMPHPATLSGHALNLVGQTIPLEFRTITEGHAIYHLAVFRFPHRERLRFRLSYLPDGETRAQALNFDQTIYREDRP